MIFSPFERMVALRYLRARREEGFVSVIAFISLASIVVGVAALIIVLSVLNGFRADLLRRVFGLSGHLAVEATGAMEFATHEAVAARIRNIDGVIRVTPVVEGQVMASARGSSRGAVVRGVPPDHVRARPTIADNIVAGSLADFSGRGIMIGDRMAARLGVVPGDRLRLVSPRRDPETMGTLPQIRSYTVAALFHIGMVEYDSSYIFMPLAAAQAHFGTGKGIGKLEVMLADADRVDELRAPIAAAARGAPVRVVHWRELNKALFNALEVERVVTFVIVALIILVAAFNIISGLIMLVRDKGRDIAILRTMGATSGMVMRIFLLAGASIGVIGTALGFALGLGLALNIRAMGSWLQGVVGNAQLGGEFAFFTNMPSQVEGADVVGVVTMSLVLSFVATLYPAWRAARLDPVEALRYE